MFASRYRWEWREPDEAGARDLAEKLGLPMLVAKVLSSRGWTDPDAVERFLNAGEQGLEDPFLMKGMTEAVERIRRALKEGERIRVYGDYDADGVTSTALMSRLLAKLGASFDTYVPHRSREGYGLNNGAIDLAAEAGVKLIVTVDNGISAAAQIAYAREIGIDVVVTDHHEPPELLPESACAIVNPKQRDCPYPYKGLAGAGVAYKLAHALLGRPATEYSDLAAIGTIADLMPLTGENRIIARLGLSMMRNDPSLGIQALAAVCGIEAKELSSGRIGFGVAPRLNAGGRLDSAESAVRLLVTEDRSEAERIAGELDLLNSERQRLVEETVKEAEAKWEQRRSDWGGQGPRVIVLTGEGWNAGVAGLVASKLVEKHYRPAIVLAYDAGTGKCKGSARSIEGFDIHAALSECSSLMDHFGGHQAAAGMTLAIDKVPELELALDRIAGERLTAEDWQPKKRVDLVCELTDASLSAVEELSRLEPFGSGNATPRVLIRDLSLRECRTLGKDGKHLRMTVVREGRPLEAVGFGLGECVERLAGGVSVDLLGELSVNEWNGNRKVQLILQDFRSDELQVFDLRDAKDAWKELDKLARSRRGSLLALSPSPRTAGEAKEREGLEGIAVLPYDFDRSGIAATLREVAAGSMLEAEQSGGPRHLALLGLPEKPEEAEALGQVLSELKRLESVHIFKLPGRRSEPGASGSSFPDRSRFGEAYAMFRERGAWIDGPDGYLRQISIRTGMSLAVVRMMQEVFEELGFIRARGAERKMNDNPPRKPLEESERYRKAKRQAEALRLADMPKERLAEWLTGLKTEGSQTTVKRV
ncbi:single-stranded-DNA-specific exonuclease RecJ [Cohnella faecalis]|uniref:Single-stranded-DNA-specific exonuclease RecJ n=1 Tax=Cohnella faecalis TaxID=2315694 RepID=A0A398CHH0_9BACL|nr:single-stranded-DNA-specific exonuclease RecJ [Cohnella faecalis]RIE00539.1 single-stranded-DNA-specific exonuclease RecJ [Cohnella faecalis]